MTAPDDKSPLEAFLEQYWEDREAGNVRELTDYLAMFSSDPMGIAREFLRCEDGGDTTVPNAPGDGTNADMLGPYRIEEELGRGGQGIVYKATDTRIGRTVALKVLKGLGPGADELLIRFKREAQAASRSDHPGVCPVYDAQVEGSVPYIAMRYVEGETLANRIASTRNEAEGDTRTTVVQLDEVIDFEDPDTQAHDAGSATTGRQTRADIMRAIRLVEKAARALHAVHEAGVIHRDVKPGNVMITPEGEAVIMDFGLAKDEDSDLQTLTRSGDFFGTPAYMSPEQLTRNSIRLDRRTDVWALGVMLYEAVTLKRPFEATSREQLYQAILSKEPESPSRANTGVGKDLATVICTALEKDRDRRYQTALGFAEELRRIREHEPISARPASSWTRLVRWSQRNPALATLTVVAAVILIAGTTVSTIFWIEADRNAAIAVANLHDAMGTGVLAAANAGMLEVFADRRRLNDLLTEANGSLRSVTRKNIDAYRDWLDRARALTERLSERVELLEVMEALPASERFLNSEDPLVFTTLLDAARDLVSGVRTLLAEPAPNTMTVAEIEQRLAQAERMR